MDTGKINNKPVFSSRWNVLYLHIQLLAMHVNVAKILSHLMKHTRRIPVEFVSLQW